jgi:hypothetical protein
MIGPRAGTRVWLAAGVTDMRCGIDSLAAKVHTSLVLKQISMRPMKPKPALASLITAVDKRQVPQVAGDEARELLCGVADLVDELKERSESLDEIEVLLTKQADVAKPGSDAQKEVSQRLKALKDAQREAEKTVKQVRVPKSSGKPDAMAKEIHDAASAALAGAILLGATFKSFKKWLS